MFVSVSCTSENQQWGVGSGRTRRQKTNNQKPTTKNQQRTTSNLNRLLVLIRELLNGEQGTEVERTEFL
ncbi:MAG TPA: hypothetical protein DCL61_29435 [Cyanobacteria bacterium UBA12227]|nr:hypothetical protein [Cyanobacteria bacterium UBA12227]HAX88635.1 hypothetical protein [Cyanobacteria bacterium UBA11370]